MTSIKIPADHPRAESLRIREKLITHYKRGIVAEAGLFAHGRGEAFDYLIGEKTTQPALKSIDVAAALLLTASHPVISVNGNTAALVAKEIVKLAALTGAKIEINLFYRTRKRVYAIKKLLEKAGAQEVLGVDSKFSARILELSSKRRIVDSRGILVADVVLVPLEDGDRTEALVKMGKKVIAVDLNPLSRTAQMATVTIVDNIVRAMPMLVEAVERLKKHGAEKCEEILSRFDNKANLAGSIVLIKQRLTELAEKGECISFGA